MLLVAAVIPFAGVTPSSATDAVNRTPSYSKAMTSDDNKASSWVGVNGSTECYKHDKDDDATSHGSVQSDKSVWKLGTAPAGMTFSLLVLKSGTVNDVWNSPTSGAKYGTKSGKDISHVIVCKKKAATSSPTPTLTTTPTDSPSPTATSRPCKKSDIVVVSKNSNLTVATVKLKGFDVDKSSRNNRDDDNEDEGSLSCWVSLNSYDTDGPTWPTSGNQVLRDHDQVLLTEDSPVGVLMVEAPLCFGQTDMYLGTTRFDGIDGALPKYPNVVTPYNLITWWNGGKACTTTPPTTEAPTTEPPVTTTPPETTTPPTTEAPTTEPPVTTTPPETTTPPTTEAPTTEPPVTTTPPVTDDSGDVNLVSPVCDGNVPYLTYEVVGASKGATITIRWINPEGDDVVYPGQPQSGKVLWPGAVVSPEGEPLDWPGWRFENGKWIQGDEFDWTRPDVQVVFEIEGLDANSAAARNADVSVSVVDQGVAKLSKVSAAVSPVNQAITVAYPPASPECAADPGVPATDDTTEVLGTKNSNLPKTGGNFAGQLALSLGLLALGALLVALPKRFAGTAAREH